MKSLRRLSRPLSATPYCNDIDPACAELTRENYESGDRQEEITAYALTSNDHRWRMLSRPVAGQMLADTRG